MNALNIKKSNLEPIPILIKSTSTSNNIQKIDLKKFFYLCNTLTELTYTFLNSVQ
jgi:hypothetical protein